MPHPSARSARTVARLLPWAGSDDQPCYLLTDDAEDGPVSRYADRIEVLQLSMSAGLLDHAEPLVDDPKADAGQLRFLAAQLLLALRDAVRIAESRGERLAEYRRSEETEGREGMEDVTDADGSHDPDEADEVHEAHEPDEVDAADETEGSPGPERSAGSVGSGGPAGSVGSVASEDGGGDGGQQALGDSS
ncbi:hypothetical protein [Streptomyces sp. NPDC093097]|uniref:hypothetical protein n=1 Tax=Streptomyces sp. NPDC093097 TaxID=3366027 RepID=UPI00380912C8